MTLMSGSYAPRPLRDVLASLQDARAHAAFDATALRMRSAPAREILAWLASDGAYGSEELRSLAQEALAMPDGTAARLMRAMPPAGLLRLAKMIAMQGIFPGDMRGAHAIYDAVRRLHGAKCLRGRQLAIALQIALFLRDYDSALSMLEQLPTDSLERRYALCDLANPFSASPHASVERWLARVNELLGESGAPPVSLNGEALPSPFDALTATLVPASIDGPKVTVAISSWRADQTLVTAVRSVVNQTWRNIEVLLVDDGSPPDHDAVLAAAVELDPERIRLLRMERNGGTYLARNRALSEATGEYFTVHDSDDWAHPARIEHQIRDLIQSDGRVGNYCVGVRADENLLFSLPGVPPFRTNESSLLFHIQTALPQIGFYDASRKGADTEYSLRMRRVLGEDAVGSLGSILSFIRLSRDSLSRSEFKAGWRHPARAAYRRGFEAWHQRTTDLRIGKPDEKRWKFARPGRYEPQQREGRVLDIVVVADFRKSSPFADLLADEVALLGEAGRQVGILHMDSFARLSPIAVEAFPAYIQEKLLQRCIVEIDLDEATATSLLFVAEPELLMYQTRLRSRVQAERVLLVPREAQDGSRSYDAATCEQACSALFGKTPEWLLASQGVVSGSAVRDDGEGWQTEKVWPAGVFGPHWAAPSRPPLEGREPVLGFDFLNSAQEPPNPEFMAAVQKLRALVWVSEGLGHAKGLPDAWSPFLPGLAPRATFVAMVDLWLHLSPPRSGESRPIAVLQAMAAGCIAILHPDWEVQFGGAAAYATAAELDRAIQSLVAAPSLCARLHANAASGVREWAGAGEFDARIRAL